MASNDKSEDEILGLDSANSNLDTDDKADGDKSCIDDEALLLNSPSPLPNQDTGESITSPKSETKAPTSPKPEIKSSASKLKSSASPDSRIKTVTSAESGLKSLVPTSSSSPQVLDISDDDDLQIIDADDEIEGVSEFEEDVEDSEDEEELFDEEDSDDSLEFDSEESNSFLDGKINIFHCHGAFLLWNADDVQMLREDCRIVGKLTGSLPRAPKQNNHLGLPLQLMPEEAKLLVDIDAAVIVEEEPVVDKTLSIRKAAIENVRAANYKIQQKLYKESRKEDVKHRMKDIIAGKKAKKQKLEEGSKKTQDAGSSTNGKGCNESAENGGDEKEEGNVDQLTVDDVVSQTEDVSEKHSLVQIFTENPWKRNVRPFVNWNYPAVDKEVIRYSVFKDLWGKGYYLTSGAKFGGDFLVYPGDPARFHSHYIAVCKSQVEEIPCLDIVTLGRLASNVRKTTLLCSMGRNRKIFYTSLQWTGMT